MGKDQPAEQFPFPVYATQGGGLVKEIAGSGVYRFVTDTGIPGYGIGETMPADWSTFPANRLAREMAKEQADELDCSLVEEYEHLPAAISLMYEELAKQLTLEGRR